MSRVQYARNGDVHIAYQVLGDAPLDLVFVIGAFSHLDVMWEEPRYRRFCERLASFCRLILFDKRGMGLSDRTETGTLEERMDDVRAVMDAIGSDRAALLGVSEGGPMATLFASTYPERATALILCGAEVRELRTEDWPWGESTRAEFEESMQSLADRWGDGKGIKHFAPTAGRDESLRKWWGRLQTQSAGPGTAKSFMRMALEIDIRHVLPSVHVPTLIIHRTEDRICDVHNGRYLADHISGSRYIELPGEDHLPFINGDEIVDEICEFLTGVRETPEPDRVLATVMFVDVVDSTARATELGDRRWRERQESFYSLVRRELARFRGREIDTAGDGFLAAFDGPARAIRCARVIVDATRVQLGMELRCGLHTGECEVIRDKLSGIAVHVGARVASYAGPSEVLVSSTVKDLVAGSGIEFADRGMHELKGVQEEWRLFLVKG
jgi:pimeloyl-ACP methyl ester carboxylesterase/class 3 adenylate cyclase